VKELQSISSGQLQDEMIALARKRLNGDVHSRRSLNELASQEQLQLMDGMGNDGFQRRLHLRFRVFGAFRIDCVLLRIAKSQLGVLLDFQAKESSDAAAR